MVLSKVEIKEYRQTNGIFWYTFAASLDPQKNKQTDGELLLPLEIPLPYRTAAARVANFQTIHNVWVHERERHTRNPSTGQFFKDAYNDSMQTIAQL
jgi:hypothetical protein